MGRRVLGGLLCFVLLGWEEAATPARGADPPASNFLVVNAVIGDGGDGCYVTVSNEEHRIASGGGAPTALLRLKFEPELPAPDTLKIVSVDNVKRLDPFPSDPKPDALTAVWSATVHAQKPKESMSVTFFVPRSRWQLVAVLEVPRIGSDLRVPFTPTWLLTLGNGSGADWPQSLTVRIPPERSRVIPGFGPLEAPLLTGKETVLTARAAPLSANVTFVLNNPLSDEALKAEAVPVLTADFIHDFPADNFPVKIFFAMEGAPLGTLSGDTPVRIQAMKGVNIPFIPPAVERKIAKESIPVGISPVGQLISRLRTTITLTNRAPYPVQLRGLTDPCEEKTRTLPPADGGTPTPVFISKAGSLEFASLTIRRHVPVADQQKEIAAVKELLAKWMELSDPGASGSLAGFHHKLASLYEAVRNLEEALKPLDDLSGPPLTTFGPGATTRLGQRIELIEAFNTKVRAAERAPDTSCAPIRYRPVPVPPAPVVPTADPVPARAKGTKLPPPSKPAERGKDTPGRDAAGGPKGEPAPSRDPSGGKQEETPPPPPVPSTGAADAR